MQSSKVAFDVINHFAILCDRERPDYACKRRWSFAPGLIFMSRQLERLPSSTPCHKQNPKAISATGEQKSPTSQTQNGIPFILKPKMTLSFRRPLPVDSTNPTRTLKSGLRIPRQDPVTIETCLPQYIDICIYVET